MSEKKQNYGIIPAGTKITFGYYCSTTLENDLRVNLSQERINKAFEDKIEADKNIGRWHISAEYKKELESRNLTQREREALDQAIVYEPDIQTLEKIKITLESAGHSQQDLDIVNDMIEHQSNSQT